MYSLDHYRLLTIIGASLCLVVAACSTPVENRDAATVPSLQADIPLAPPAKNVILFIGDGMGVSTVTAIRILDGQQKGMPGEENVLSFERFDRTESQY